MFGSSGKGQDGSGGKAEKTLGDFLAEYAKSNRSMCKGCLEKIEKVQLVPVPTLPWCLSWGEGVQHRNALKVGGDSFLFWAGPGPCSP